MLLSTSLPFSPCLSTREVSWPSLRWVGLLLSIFLKSKLLSLRWISVPKNEAPQNFRYQTKLYTIGSTANFWAKTLHWTACQPPVKAGPFSLIAWMPHFRHMESQPCWWSKVESGFILSRIQWLMDVMYQVISITVPFSAHRYIHVQLHHIQVKELSSSFEWYLSYRCLTSHNFAGHMWSPLVTWNGQHKATQLHLCEATSNDQGTIRQDIDHLTQARTANFPVFFWTVQSSRFVIWEVCVSIGEKPENAAGQLKVLPIWHLKKGFK